MCGAATVTATARGHSSSIEIAVAAEAVAGLGCVTAFRSVADRARVGRHVLFIRLRVMVFEMKLSA